jgi:hypothetical protein
MEVEDRLTQRIGLVSGKRWACAPLKSPILCRTDADVEGRLHSLYGVTAAKRCLKKFAVSRAVEFPDANFEIWKTSVYQNQKQLITLKEHGEHLSEDDVEKDT